ncbi:MAG: iron transporter FeoA [Methanoculleus sp. SDB]|nr:MAG: iron transporter FeoA [Methanoculleus sp. SDB]
MRKKLSDLAFGEKGVVTEILASGRELNCMGLRKGKQLKMITKQPIKGPVVVLIGEVEIAMGIRMAEQITVETG